MEAIPQKRMIQSPCAIFIPRAQLNDLLGFYIYVEPSLDEVRSKVQRFLMSEFKGWLVFGITSDIKLQNQFLKFLEEYSGNVALHSDYPVRLISTIESRCLSVHKNVYLPKLVKGPGLSSESKDPLKDARSPLVLKKLITTRHLQGQLMRVLTLVDRL